MRSSAQGCCLRGLKPFPLDTEDAALLWRSCVALSMLPEGVMFADGPSSPYCPCPGPLSVGLLGSLCAHHRSLLQGLAARRHAGGTSDQGAMERKRRPARIEQWGLQGLTTGDGDRCM